MPPTVIRGVQVLDGSIQRSDHDTTTTGQATVTKLVQGTNVTLVSTGVDSGTGDVTISAPAAGVPAYTQVITSSFTVPSVGSTVVVNVANTSWALPGEWVYAEDAGGAGIAGLLLITAKTSTTLTLQN